MGSAIPRLTDLLVPLSGPLRMLDRWAPVTVVRGMQGYGKTSLVGSWLREQSSVRVLWFSATTSTDVATEIVEELRQRLGVTGTPMGDSTPTADERAEAALPTDEQRTVIVIDNAHQVRDEHTLRWLVELLHQRHDLHLILCSRGHHPMQTLADGRIEIVTIRAGTLLFKAEDTAELARQMSLTLSQAHLDELHAEFGGWPAAIRLVLEEIDGNSSNLPLTRAQRYLRDSVLPGIVTVEILAAVMGFAIAERLTHNLIRDLAEDYPPDQLIAMIESPGLCEPRHLNDDVELILPTFIRRTLREVFTAGHPDQARRMHRRMAAWFAGHSGLDHHLFALRHALAAEAWDQFDSVWTSRGLSLATEQPAAILNILDRVPEHVIARRPAMTVIHAALSSISPVPDSGLNQGSDCERWLRAHREYAHTSATLAARGFADMALPDMLTVGAGYLISLRTTNRAEDADRIGADLDGELARRRASGEKAGDQLAWFYLQRGLTDSLRLHHGRALRWYTLSRRHCHDSASFIASVSAANLALTHAVNGRHRRARTWLARYSGSGPRTDWVGCGGADIAAGLLALDRLEPNLDERVLHQRTLRQLGEDAAATELWPYAAFLQAQYDLLHSPPLNGIATLDHTRHTHQGEESAAATALLARARADLLIANGQAQRAQTLTNSIDLDQHPILAVPHAWISLLAGQHAAARLVCARAVWREDTNDRDRIELLLIEALATYRMDEPETSADLTRKALALRQHSGILKPFAMLPGATRDTLLANANAGLGNRATERLQQLKSPYPQAVTLVTLTSREQGLAALLTQTGSREQIADQLFLSVNTVKKQLNTLYRKLDASTRTEALARLEQLGLNDS